MTCHPETSILILKTGLPSATHLCYTPEKLAFLEDIAKKDGKSYLILQGIRWNQLLNRLRMYCW